MLQDRGAMLTGLGIGAGLMYFLDPAGGRRRRALVRDRVVHATHVASDAAGATGRDMANRASGIAARLRGASRRGTVDDQILVERVRAQLGRVASHPRALDVVVDNGVVTLRGPILQDEVSAVCKAVERVNGVASVVNELDEYRDAVNMPALQGGREVRGIWQREWSPTTRLVTALVATAGVGLLARAATQPGGVTRD
jgi:BON domain